MAKILIVDDDEDFVMIQSVVLSHAGHDVQSACNGRKALEMLDQFQCSIVVTDIMMPQMDGIEFIMELRKRLDHCKIIAMTGGSWVAAPMHLKIARSLGAVTTLSKPVSGRQLLETIQSTLAMPPVIGIHADCPIAA